MSIDSILTSNHNFALQRKLVSDVATNARKLSDPNNLQYETIADMSPAELELFNKATSDIGQSEKYIIGAQNIFDKTTAASSSINRIRDPLNTAIALINGYNKNAMDQGALDNMKSAVNQCLSVFATELNSTYADGKFIFGNGTTQPVSREIIVNALNVAPNGTISDSFTNDKSKSEDQMISISSNKQENAIIKSNEDAIVHLLGGIGGIKKLLDAATVATLPTTLPATSLALIEQGTSEFNDLTTDVHQRFTNAKNAIDENKDIQAEAGQNLDKMKINALELMSKMKDGERLISVLMAIEMSRERAQDRIADIITGR